MPIYQPFSGDIWKKTIFPAFVLSATLPFLGGCDTQDNPPAASNPTSLQEQKSSTQTTSSTQLTEEPAALSITLDQQKCIGCGKCVRVAPANFSMDQSARKASITSQSRANESAIQEAINICPVNAIKA